MKRQFWTGGVLLIMILWGLTGAAAQRPRCLAVTHQNRRTVWQTAPALVYTSEDQTPFAGTWRDADSTVVLEIEGQGARRAVPHEGNGQRRTHL